MASRRDRGFTLIEVLVVIAIIAILAGIIFPVFAKAKAKGWEATCINNVKQILTAIQMYRQDAGDRWPLHDLGPGSGISEFTGNAFGLIWADSIQPYVRNTQVFQCPVSGADVKLAYGMNPYVQGTGVAIAYDDANTIGLADDVIQQDFPGAGLRCADGAIGTRTDFDPVRDVAARHTDGAVFGFLDGHAKRLSVAQTLSPGNMWTLQ